jgi:hypothetical protein
MGLGTDQLDFGFDKSANKAAVLELQLLRDSVSKLGMEASMLREHKLELEEMRNILKEDVLTQKNEANFFKDKLQACQVINFCKTFYILIMGK